MINRQMFICLLLTSAKAQETFPLLFFFFNETGIQTNSLHHVMFLLHTRTHAHKKPDTFPIIEM